jgi:putative transposase
VTGGHVDRLHDFRSVGYKRHRFPPAIIAHAVWLYFRFPRSLRLVEEMLQERGIVVSYETVRW